jgi:hypothetical protein
MKSADLTNLISGKICRAAADEFLVSVRIRKTHMNRTGCERHSEIDMADNSIHERERLWIALLPCPAALYNCPA